MVTEYHAKYYAWALTRKRCGGDIDRLSQSLFDASVDLNPHQIDAALFALQNPLSKGVVLADEVGLGKTIEAALVLCQYWAERRRRLLVICPAALRDQLLAAEQMLDDTKARLRDAKRRARFAGTVEEERQLQNEIKQLEKQQRRQRQEIFDVEDQIEEKRDQLIAALESRLKQKTVTHPLFRIRWEIV